MKKIKLRHFAAAAVIGMIVACFLAVIQVRKFVAELRNHSSAAKASAPLAMAVNATENDANPESSSSEESAKEVSDQESKGSLDSDVATKPGSSKMSQQEINETIAMIKESPPIDTCTYLTANRARLFQRFKERPKTFQILVMNRTLEISLVASRLPKNLEIMYHQEEPSTVANDLRYAYLVYQAKREVEQNFEDARRLEVHGYYARVLAQIAFQNPSVVGDPELVSLCQALTDLNEPLPQELMNQKIHEFAARAQVKIDEIDFDPQYVSKLFINKKSVTDLWFYALPKSAR
ncbi:MAG: hypothetical protein EOP04_21375 [Proteobacteria bacterium]|nr:MAG: hypothetical protein EOP04_21375 [Pseudomonadota bacterium]